MTALRILAAGPACTLQDGGRHGWLRYGVTPAGPMDWIAHAVANRLAGHPADAGAVEVGPGGITVTAEGAPLHLGISATGFAVARDGHPLPARGAVTLDSGQTLTIRPGDSHIWAYLSVAGGLALEPVMGSLSTHLRSGIGPTEGRALREGDRLPCRGGHAVPCALPEAPALPDTLRFVPGPQADAFTEAALTTFCTAPFTLSPRSDRMGYRLEGPRLTHARGHDIVSDGIALGAIQVPGDGQPIVLMADRQPTGGYPKIGTIIRADLPVLAQSRPGRALRFQPVGVEAAVAALRAAMAGIEADLRAAVTLSVGPDLAKLASGDHASGMIDARTPG